MVNAGKYTIHGWYGYGMDIQLCDDVFKGSSTVVSHKKIHHCYIASWSGPICLYGPCLISFIFTNGHVEINEDHLT